MFFSPFWKTIIDALDETLVVQLGASFVAPFLFWIILCFGPEFVAWLVSQKAMARQNPAI